MCTRCIRNIVSYITSWWRTYNIYLLLTVYTYGDLVGELFHYWSNKNIGKQLIFHYVFLCHDLLWFSRMCWKSNSTIICNNVIIKKHFFLYLWGYSRMLEDWEYHNVLMEIWEVLLMKWGWLDHYAIIILPNQNRK